MEDVPRLMQIKNGFLNKARQWQVQTQHTKPSRMARGCCACAEEELKKYNGSVYYRGVLGLARWQVDKITQIVHLKI